jgi:glycosyltransferase involved in cell wall biosynthesis
MSDPPLISVIIPAHNAARFIERTLTSAQRQTYGNIEIIVVDDGSEDQTPVLVEDAASRDARIRLLGQPHRGVAVARNHAIAHARGEFIAPLDADDLWFPTKLEQQMLRMRQAGPTTGLVYSWWVAVNEDDTIVGAADRWTVEGDAFQALVLRNFIGNASVPLIRRACLDQVGTYDTTLRARGGQGCEDWDLTLRIAEHYDVRCAPAYLSGYRAVDDSMSTDVDAMGRSYDFIIGAIEQRHPEIASELLQWSRSNFYQYLASTSYNSGQFVHTLRWLRHVVRVDPLALLSTGVIKMAFKSAVRHTARPLSSLIWPDRQAWLRFKRNVLPTQTRSISIAQLHRDPTSVPESWRWKRWKPYDRIWRWRWQRVVEQSNAQVLTPDSSQTGNRTSTALDPSTRCTAI